MSSTEVREMVGLPDSVKRATSPATREQMVDLLTGSDTSAANPAMIKDDLTSAARSLSYCIPLLLTQGHG